MGVSPMVPPPALAVSIPDAAAVPLTRLRVGAVGTLHEVRDVESRGVLRSLGLTDHCRLRLCQAGDPCIVQVEATRIGLSRTVAQCLFVVPEPGDGR
jgi:Fe2+ transport system protein FeoA